MHFLIIILLPSSVVKCMGCKTVLLCVFYDLRLFSYFFISADQSFYSNYFIAELINISFFSSLYFHTGAIISQSCKLYTA